MSSGRSELPNADDADDTSPTARHRKCFFWRSVDLNRHALSNLQSYLAPTWPTGSNQQSNVGQLLELSAGTLA